MTNRVQVTKEEPGRRAQWARLCLESAMFSAIVYRHDNPTPDNAKQASYEKYLTTRGWQRRGVCKREKGDGANLYFEVWENDTRHPREIVFAFRGTSGGPDWAANLRWFRFHRPRDHYYAAYAECVPLIHRFWSEKGGDKPIISTTGHSLGGGLAQEILYAASDKVDHSIVFDPSPVTALSDLSPEEQKVYHQQLNRSKFSQYRIIRAYERGEILMFARNIVSLVYKPDSQNIAIEFNTRDRLTAVGKHSITLLTEHLKDLVKDEGETVNPAEFRPTPLDPPEAYHDDPTFRSGKAVGTMPSTTD
jgi:pimeloyl-ACP methyl ester carboxylesterase